MYTEPIYSTALCCDELTPTHMHGSDVNVAQLFNQSNRASPEIRVGEDESTQDRAQAAQCWRASFHRQVCHKVLICCAMLGATSSQHRVVP